VLPGVGFVLEHEGAAYTVTEPWMSPALFAPYRLGETKTGEAAKETKRTGFHKLLKIVARICGSEQAGYAMISTMESIGSADRPERTAAGIELPSAKLATQFDDVIFLRTKRSEKTTPRVIAKAFRIETALLARFSAENHPCLGAPNTKCGGGENIILTEDAAK